MCAPKSRWEEINTITVSECLRGISTKSTAK